MKRKLGGLHTATQCCHSDHFPAVVAEFSHVFLCLPRLLDLRSHYSHWVKVKDLNAQGDSWRVKEELVSIQRDASNRPPHQTQQIACPLGSLSLITGLSSMLKILCLSLSDFMHSSLVSALNRCSVPVY